MITMKNIIDDKNPMIREISQEVTLPLSEEDQQLAHDMMEYLIASQDEEKAEKYDLRPGVGLAAVQVGVLKRMCAILVPYYDKDGHETRVDKWVLVNPKIVAYTPKPAYLANGEGCLSVPVDQHGIVPRHAKIVVEAFDALTNEHVKITARGYTAICIQHEMDHFDGILYYDHFNKENPNAPIPNAMVIE